MALMVREPMGSRRERQGGKKGVSSLERYIYRLIDRAATLLFMITTIKMTLPQRQAQYAKLRERLAQTGWISEGYVQDRGPGAGGPCYQWTRKVRGKTISVVLSREQYEWLGQAILNWRQTQEILKEMQQLSRQVLFATIPHPRPLA